MKKARRIGSWLLVIVMLCGMMGCAKDSEPTPEEVYVAAYEKINALTGIDAEMTMGIAMTAEGETMEAGVEASLLMEEPNSEKMKMDMEMTMTMDMLGVAMDIHAYYVDGYYLMETMGQKIKYPMDLEEAMGQSAMMQEVALDALSEITMTEEDGMRILTFSVDAKKLMEDEMEDYLHNIPLVVNSAGLTYKEFQGVMKVNEEGYPVEITMQIGYTTWVKNVTWADGAKIDCDANIVMVYKDLGQPVTVEIPDASEYIEMDPETMS